MDSVDSSLFPTVTILTVFFENTYPLSIITLKLSKGTEQEEKHGAPYYILPTSHYTGESKKAARKQTQA